jgi:hypothetical protein
MPATPAPITSTRAGGAAPAAVKTMGMNGLIVTAATTTAR